MLLTAIGIFLCHAFADRRAQMLGKTSLTIIVPLSPPPALYWCADLAPTSRMKARIVGWPVSERLISLSSQLFALLMSVRRNADIVSAEGRFSHSA